MIRVKAVDSQNVLNVCELTTNQNAIGAATKESFCRNAIFIAEAKYNLEMYANKNVKNLYLSFGFHFTGKIDKADYYRELEF